MNYVNPDTGEKMSFPEVVTSLLVAEHGMTQETAEQLVKSETQVMMSGIMGGMNYRATAMALEMKHADDPESEFAVNKI
jgi:hypothetical protein